MSQATIERCSCVFSFVKFQLEYTSAPLDTLHLQMYPAQIRSTAHGLSAATGKVGSILVVVWLNYLGNRTKFWVTWPFALLGAAICWAFVADNTGLDLAEQVRHLFPLLLPSHLTSCALTAVQAGAVVVPDAV